MAKDKNTTSSKSQQDTGKSSNEKPTSYGTKPSNFEEENNAVTVTSIIIDSDAIKRK